MTLNLDRLRSILKAPVNGTSRQAVRAGSIGIIDQVIISGMSFLVMIVAARELGPGSFGVYALLYTLLLSIQAIQESLITAPFGVLGVSKEGDSYRRYLSSVALLQVGLAIIFAVVLVLAGAVALRFDTAVGWMLMALAFAAAAWQFQELMRRILYTELRFEAVLLNDAVTQVLRFGLLMLLVVTGNVTGDRLFLVLGATWFAGIVVGVWQIRHNLTPNPGRDTLRGAGQEHWQFGRWLLVTNGVSYVPWYLTAAIMSSVLTTSAYGAYRAFDQIVNGAYVPLQALNNILRPRLAREAASGTGVVWRTMLPIMKLGGIGLGIFGLLLIGSQEFLFATVFGAEYVAFTPSMFLLAMTPLALLQKNVLTIALQAFRITRPIFTGAVLSAIVHSVASLAVFPLFGLHAAGAPELLGFCTATAYLGWVWRKHVARERANEQSPATPAVEPRPTR